MQITIRWIDPITRDSYHRLLLLLVLTYEMKGDFLKNSLPELKYCQTRTILFILYSIVQEVVCKIPWDGIFNEISGCILRFLRLKDSTFDFAFLQHAVHEQMWLFFIDWLFCKDFWNQWGSMVFCQIFCVIYTCKCCLYRNKIFHFQKLF